VSVHRDRHAGSSERALYPSLASWRLILDALAEAFPEARFVLLGKLERDSRTSSTLDAASSLQPAASSRGRCRTNRLGATTSTHSWPPTTGDAAAIWSIDGVHREYLPAA